MSANDVKDPNRRDFLYIATAAMGAVGAASVAWPFIDQMNPSAETRAAGLPVEIDVSSIEAGQSVTIMWRSKPYFIRRLTSKELSEVSKVSLTDLKDPQAANERIGGSDAKDLVIVASNCTHLGCIPKEIENGAEGWKCPCHGSVFDMTGRILRGPAATNLPVPPYVFVTATKLIVGTTNPEEA